VKKKVAVMGGGTGTFPVISGLRHFNAEVYSIITVSDNGGSTGRIRDEFGFQPVGDLRQALAALAEDEGQEWIRKILLYRFDRGKGLEGHNLGNLILTALQDMTGDTTEALKIAAKIFRIQGKVIPVSREVVDLEIKYEDGQVVVGEDALNYNGENPKKIIQVKLIPFAKVNAEAAHAIQSAEVVVIGPGDYYASLMPTLIPEGIKEVFASSQAEIVYIVNLMTRHNQTHGMTAKDHLQGIETAIGRPVDTIIMNSMPIPKQILQVYAAEQEFPVVDDLEGDTRVVRAEVISQEMYQAQPQDALHRSVLRHDPDALGKILKKILEK
jgi:uncharacterized cofD-like protein